MSRTYMTRNPSLTMRFEAPNHATAMSEATKRAARWFGVDPRCVVVSIDSATIFATDAQIRVDGAPAFGAAEVVAVAEVYHLFETPGTRCATCGYDWAEEAP